MSDITAAEPGPPAGAPEPGPAGGPASSFYAPGAVARYSLLKLFGMA